MKVFFKYNNLNTFLPKIMFYNLYIIIILYLNIKIIDINFGAKFEKR